MRAELRPEHDPPAERVADLAARLARTVPQYADQPFHRVLVLREGSVVHTADARELDEHRVLDLVMEGSPSA